MQFGRDLAAISNRSKTYIDDWEIPVKTWHFLWKVCTYLCFYNCWVWYKCPHFRHGLLCKALKQNKLNLHSVYYNLIIRYILGKADIKSNDNHTSHKIYASRWRHDCVVRSFSPSHMIPGSVPLSGTMGIFYYSVVLTTALWVNFAHTHTHATAMQ